MRLTESTLRRIVREEIVGQAVREGKMTLREGRRLMEEVLPDEVKGMGLKVSDPGKEGYQKGKVYDVDAQGQYRVVPTGFDGASMTSALVISRKPSGLEIVTTYDKEKNQTTSELRGPRGTIKKMGPSKGKPAEMLDLGGGENDKPVFAYHASMLKSYAED